MTAKIVNPRHGHGVAALVTPPPYGYLLMAATIAPPKLSPIVWPNATRTAVLRQVAARLEEVGRLASVVRATGYRAVLIPPVRARGPRPERPRFDVTVLIETDSPDSITPVADSSPVAALRNALYGTASRLTEIRARCAKATYDVDKHAGGTYGFNYWAAADTATALDLFDHLAPWFETKTGLNDSTVLQPLDPNEYTFVNHVRWDAGSLVTAVHQFIHPSLYRFVLPNLAANHVTVYPALYRTL